MSQDAERRPGGENQSRAAKSFVGDIQSVEHETFDAGDRS